MVYDVDYYVHVDTTNDASSWCSICPTRSCPDAQALTIRRTGGGQAINQLVTVTPLEQVNEKIHDLTDMSSPPAGVPDGLRYRAQHGQGPRPPRRRGMRSLIS